MKQKRGNPIMGRTGSAIVNLLIVVVLLAGVAYFGYVYFLGPPGPRHENTAGGYSICIPEDWQVKDSGSKTIAVEPGKKEGRMRLMVTVLRGEYLSEINKQRTILQGMSDMYKRFDDSANASNWRHVLAGVENMAPQPPSVPQTSKKCTVVMEGISKIEDQFLTVQGITGRCLVYDDEVERPAERVMVWECNWGNSQLAVVFRAGPKDFDRDRPLMEGILETFQVSK